MFKTVSKNRSNICNDRRLRAKANSPEILNRLIGIETEYGSLSVTATGGQRPRPIIHDVRNWFLQRMPIAADLRSSTRFFTAYGGAVGVEPFAGLAEDDGLVEASTPECRSPHELITYQLAQDEMLVECLNDLRAGRGYSKELPSRWIKNSGDAFGNGYGQQENYQVDIATGWRLAVWRIGLALMLPMLILYRILAANWLLFVFATSKLVSFFGLLRQKLRPRSGSSPIGDKYSTPGIHPRVVRLAALGLRRLHAPIAYYFHWLICSFALVPHRKFMAGFLMSRGILDGTGHLDQRGRYWISARASMTTSMIGFGRYWHERPIFVTGHWLSSILSDASITFQGWRSLFARKQRIQISLGDSTPNDWSQYLRVGSTTLVLDMVESEWPNQFPLFDNLVAGLKSLHLDRALLRSVSDQRGVAWTALDIQRLYASAARTFVTQNANAPIEALEIVNRWQETLDRLEEHEADPGGQRWLLGRVDWFGKRWLMDQVSSEAPWAVKKKVDLKYHELSQHGYYRMLRQAMDIEELSLDEEIERAKRMPPANTPATRRGYFIREFSRDVTDFAVDWETVAWVDSDGKRHRVNLH